MADGLDFTQLPEEGAAPQATKLGLDFASLEGAGEPSAVPPSPLDFNAFATNPNLDDEDRMTFKIYSQNVVKSLASGIEPVSRYYKHAGQGAIGTIGRAMGGAGTGVEMAADALDLKTNVGMGGPLTFGLGIAALTAPVYKSLGARLAKLGEMQDDGKGNWVTDEFAHGLGSAVPYVATGLAGGTAAATTLGVVDMGQSLYDDAKAHGATEDDARLAYLAGGAIGTTEALPIGYFLQRVNKLSGGSFYEIAKGLQGAGPLKEAVKGFFLSGTTEAGQELMSNWVAKDLVAYDPTRKLSENLASSFTTGGAVGSLLMGVTGSLAKNAKKQAEDELEAEYQQKLATEDPINAIAGQFAPLLNLPGLRIEEAELTEDLRKRGQEFLKEQEKYLVPDDFVSQPKQGLEYLGADAGPQDTDVGYYMAKIAPTQVDPDVEKAVVEKGKPMTVDEALKKTPVVATLVAPYRDQLQVVAAKIKALDKMYVEGKGDAAQIKKDAAALNAVKDQLQHKTKLARLYVRHMKDYVASFREALGDETRFVIGDYTGREDGSIVRRGGVTNGEMALYHNTAMIDGKKVPLVRIDLDLDALATARYNEEISRKGWYSTPETRTQRQKMFEVLNHELGHYIVSKRLGELFQTSLHGKEESLPASEILAAVEADYAKWLKKQHNGQLYHYVDNVATPNYQGGVEEPGTYASDIPKTHRNYLFSFDEYFAQQTARMATQGKLAQEGVITKFFKPVLEQYKKVFEAMPALAKNEYGGSFEKFVKKLSLQHQISEEIQKALANGPKSLYDALKGLPGFDPANFAGLKDQLDKWNQVMDVGQNILQIAKQNQHIQGLRDYVTYVRAWAAYSRSIDAKAVETIKEWRKLGKKKMEAVTETLFEETAQKKRFSPAELQQRLPDASQQKVYAQIRQDFDWVLSEMEAASLEQIRLNHPENETMRNAELAKTQAEFKKMREGGYFPYMRFGKWTLTIRARIDMDFDDEHYSAGDLISFESFESKAERDKALRMMQGKDPDLLVSPSVMKESQFAVQGLPAAMLRTMKERIPNLDKEQVAAIDEALKDLAPFKGLKRQFLRRRGTAGFSMDAMRSYAHYMRMSAGHLSRVKYAEKMMQSIAKVDGDAKVLSHLGKDSTKRQQIANWMKQHNDYIVNPESEWTGLRSAIFQWFLGFNIKSAVINLSQVPMVTFPYLAARYGDLNAAREIATANAAATSYWKNRQKWTGPQAEPRRVRIVQLLEQGKKDGWLDQALATELAIAASEGTVDRALPVRGAKHAWYKMSEWGAKPFAVAEKINRTITAIATYNLEYAKSNDHRTAYAAARDAVDSTQYENSRWNRPRFMRGKLGTTFVFMNYLQNTLFFMLGGDKGGGRALMMLFLAAGLMGMPGAENAEDLVDFLGTKLKELLGSKDPKFDLRLELREALQELHANPDLILHGLGQSSFGLGALGQMTGLPIPEFDISGSLSLGRPLPLTGLLNSTGQDTSQGVLGKAAVELGGAGASAFDSFLQGIWSRDPDKWKATEKMLPTWMKNASKATRLASRGEEKTMRGDVVAEFDPYDPKEALELFGQGLGFTPTELTEGWERTLAQREGVNYYRMRMEGLLKAHNWTFLNEDEDAKRDALQKIKEYNEVVPWPELKIGPKTIKESLVAYAESQKMTEMGMEQQKRYVRLRQSIEAAYADSPAEGRENIR
jgi:hypothetical protein